MKIFLISFENKDEKMKHCDIEVRVICADTDAMGIVYHANYLKWFEAVRNEFLREIGYPYTLLSEMGLSFPVVEAHLNYKSPAKYDDLISIRAEILELKAASIKMGYEICNKKTGDLLVTGYTRSGVTNSALKPINMKKSFPEFYKAMENTIQ